MTDILNDSERHIIRSFGHPEDENFGDEALARRVLEFPNTDERWYVASAVTLAGGYLLALDRLEAAEVERNEALQGPWPEWAEKLLRIMEEFGAEYDADDEINLPDELAEWLHHYASDLKRTAKREAAKDTP
ncbi:MAG: hypothetical protein BroJett013_06720 [Alphaproteobacteria bacterium]|nr:MAG: hypothetical protein BroJett013_06720 [Alphaproteobacteria bacterium]